MFFDIVALQRIQKRNVSSVYTGVMAGESNFDMTKKQYILKFSCIILK